MILFITRKYPPSIGGMQRLSFRLTTEVARQTDARTISWGRGQWGLPLFVAWAFCRALVYLARRDVELIHIGDPVLCPLGRVLGWLARAPVAVTAHGLDVIYPSPIYQAMVRCCLPRMDRVICISRDAWRECINRGVQTARCSNIPPGIDPCGPVSLPDAERQALAARWGIPLRDRSVLLTSGRLVPRKGVASFVAGVRPLLLAARDDWVYLVAGDGPERHTIEAVVARNGLSDHVRLLGAINDSDLAAAYALADVFIMPNLPVPGTVEGFGIVVLEARAAGAPVVAAGIEGIREAAGGADDSTLVPPGDWPAFDAAIETWLDRAEGIQARELRRQRVLAEFAWPRVAARYMAVFNEMTGRSGRSEDGVGVRRD